MNATLVVIGGKDAEKKNRPDIHDPNLGCKPMICGSASLINVRTTMGIGQSPDGML